MSQRTVMAGLLAGAVFLALGSSAPAAGAASTPVFADNPSAGWFAYKRQFIQPASGPGPVVEDPKHPQVSNDEFRLTGKQPTFPVADINNPILQPWAKDVLRKSNELALSGTPGYSLHANCYPIGVLEFLLEPMTRPMHIIQGPKEVVLVLESFNDVRRIYLSDKHSPNVKPSWYGDSIGHYEGDTLVVDTIGLSDKTVVDGFHTPHTNQLHVTERFHRVDNGRELQVDIHVEDPGAFTMPWNAVQRYRGYEATVSKGVANLAVLATPEEGPLNEAICMENPFSLGMGARTLPQAKAADF
jgi:hypothetical protein